jgi:hypothetical protein
MWLRVIWAGSGRGALAMAANRLGDEHGAALVCALMVMTLVAALGGALAFLVASETMISANYRTAHEILYAADAGLDGAAAELRRISSWSDVLLAPPGNTTSAVDDGSMMPRAPDGTTLDLAQLTSALQADSDTRFGPPGANPNSPRWRLFAHGGLDRLLPAGLPSPPAYLVVWVADDVEDGDGDVEHDANGVIMMRSVAFGPRGGRRAIEATLARAGDLGGGSEAPVRVFSWRDVR